MGQSKLLLPWGDTTVLGQVVAAFAVAGLEDILVVTGRASEPIVELITRLAKIHPVREINNPAYTNGSMISSIQAGLAALGEEVRAALIGLGDQPQIREETVRHICDTFTRTGNLLVAPSFQGRRGHPWLVARPLWPEFLAPPHFRHSTRVPQGTRWANRVRAGRRKYSERPGHPGRISPSATLDPKRLEDRPCHLYQNVLF
jgi:molybdenum cofactor cytidylyltransferase